MWVLRTKTHLQQDGFIGFTGDRVSCCSTSLYSEIKGYEGCGLGESNCLTVSIWISNFISLLLIRRDKRGGG